MGFVLSDMKLGEFCHGRCVCLLLADRMQSIGAGEPNAKTLGTGIGLKSGVWRLGVVGYVKPKTTFQISASSLRRDAI